MSKRAIVVGSGPNGLAAAITLAEAGLSVLVLEADRQVGGGMRSGALTVPGLQHDQCSASHPLAVSSPFLTGQRLDRLGLRWALPEVQIAHPLDDGDGAALWRSLDRTAGELGADGPAWRRTFGPLVGRYDALVQDLLMPVLHVPRHPRALSSFTSRAVLPATVLAQRWRDEATRALFVGTAAHAIGRLDRPLSSAVGLLLGSAAHVHGWPVAVGGSQSLADALVARLRELGGEVRTGTLVTDWGQLDGADLVLLDTAPGAAADLLGDRLPPRIARSYRRFRHGPGAFKVDFAVDGGVPWRFEPARRAGVVHVGGTVDEMVAAESAVVAGRMPVRPYVLVGQQSLADQGRAQGNLQPVYAYAHVPHGFTGDATESIVAQLERFAPGFRSRVVSTAVRTTTQMARHNPNYVGGDIAGGAISPYRLIARPRLSVQPYATGVPGVYLCSASTPPGAGVHGMCGANAAGAALAAMGAT